MDWKKKLALIQTLTLLLCTVLLAVTVQQGREIKYLLSILDGRIENVYNQGSRIDCGQSGIMSELQRANSQIQSCALDTEVNTAARSLNGTVTLTMREWGENTQVYLTADQKGDVWTIPLTGTGTGSFTGSLALSLDDVSLCAEIHSGGTQRRESLGTWNPADQLPVVQSYGFGGWYDAAYERGGLTVGTVFAELRTEVIEDPTFRMYGGSGTLLSEQLGTYAGNGLYEAKDWSADCEPTDIVFTFSCRDGKGLAYTFPLAEAEISGNTLAAKQSISAFASDTKQVTWEKE